MASRTRVKVDSAESSGISPSQLLYLPWHQNKLTPAAYTLNLGERGDGLTLAAARSEQQYLYADRIIRIERHERAQHHVISRPHRPSSRRREEPTSYSN